MHAVHCQGPHNPSPRNGTVLRGQRSSGDAGLPRQGFHLGHSHLFSVPSISIISLSIFSCSTTLSFYRGGKEGGHSVCMAFVPSWKRQNFGTVHCPSQFWVIHLFDRQKGGNIPETTTRHKTALLCFNTIRHVSKHQGADHGTCKTGSVCCRGQSTSGVRGSPHTRQNRPVHAHQGITTE